MKYVFLALLSTVLFLSVKASDRVIFGEKLYFTTNAEIYNPGDTIYLCGILSDEQVLGPTHYSYYANVELIDEADSVVLRHKVAVKDGVFRCVVPLDVMLSRGVYYLRAYTELMRSFRPESFLIRPVFVGEAPPVNYNSGIPASVVFYPESGNWVAGSLQGMTICVKNRQGFPIEVKAVLLRENADTIVSKVQTNSNGLGIFYLVPEQGVHYSLHFENEIGSEPVSFQLPETGDVPSFRAVINDNKLNYQLNPSNRNDEEVYNLLIWHRGRCLAEQPVSVQKPEGVVLLPDDLEGIVSCVLVNEKKEALAEVLLFMQMLFAEKRGDCPVSTVCEAGEAITLDIDADYIGVPLIARIVPVKQDLPDYLQQSLPATFMLTSDVSSAVYAPDSYFKGDAGTNNLDLLLKTLRWGRYNWIDVQSDTFVYTYPPEDLMVLKGSVLSDGDKLLKGGSLICFNNETGLAYDCDIQSDGTFVIGLDDYDSGSAFYIQPFDKRRNSEGLTIEFEENTYPPVVNPVKEMLLTQGSWIEFNDQQIFKSYYESNGERVVQVPEIVVKRRIKTAHVPTEQFYSNRYIKPETLELHTDMRQVLRGFQSVILVEKDKDGNDVDPYLRSRRGPSTLEGDSKMIVLLDGLPVETKYILDMIDIRSIESVSYLTPGQSSVYASNSLEGALFVKTKDFKYAFNSMGVNYKPVGLSSLDGFNNNIMGVTSGKENITLIAPQDAGMYQLILEGIDGGGSPFLHCYPFLVEE